MIDFKKHLPFTLFFGVIFFLNILFMYVLQDYRMVAKPMIMASLIGFYITVERRQSNAFVLAMIFALLGDVFLMFKGDDFFLIGLLCFMVMQLLYTFLFSREGSKDMKRLLMISLPLLLLTVGVISVLWNDLGDLRIPVLVYAMAISAMVISAIYRKNVLKGYSAVVLGVVLFLISDAVLAISKFGGALPFQDIVIMSTYMTAQFLIVRGMVAAHALSK
jgi:uncharacterized membrane protein YhhN